MSEPQAKPQPAAPHDPVQELALQLYIELCGQVYSRAGEKPQPLALVKLCFELAETYQKGNYQFNAVARAAREAKEKASVNLDSVQIDFASFEKPK